MRIGFVLVFLLMPAVVKADLTVSPRYEHIRGKQKELANRILVKAKLNSALGPFVFFAEGFSEYEGNEDQIFIRRSPARGYLQEAYLEYKMESFFVRVGRQALRWSESWTLPSLDIWTGRRYNRLYFDPLADQLTHSTGASFSYVKGDFSLDLVGIGELAENIYPIPLPEAEIEKNTSFGGRAKWSWGGVGFSALAAQVLKRNYYGFAGNYALDVAVPKFELGYSHDTTPDLPVQRDTRFATAGCDLFLGTWVVLPQVSYFEVIRATGGSEFQTSYYVSAQWNPNRHDIQMQVYQNPNAKDVFAGLSYGYNFTDYFTASGFVQNYDGQEGLYKIYKEITGGPVFGVRFEMTGNLVF